MGSGELSVGLSIDGTVWSCSVGLVTMVTTSGMSEESTHGECQDNLEDEDEDEDEACCGFRQNCENLEMSSCGVDI